MKIEIRNFKSNGKSMGYVAHFDLMLDNIGTLRNLTLIRPDIAPEHAWLRFPNLADGNTQAFWLTPDMRNEAGRRAAAMYEAATGVRLEYTPPRGKHFAEVEAPAEEDDAAGLRRVIGETCERAGL